MTCKDSGEEKAVGPSHGLLVMKSPVTASLGVRVLLVPETWEVPPQVLEAMERLTRCKRDLKGAHREKE